MGLRIVGSPLALALALRGPKRRVGHRFESVLTNLLPTAHPVRTRGIAPTVAPLIRRSLPPVARPSTRAPVTGTWESPTLPAIDGSHGTTSRRVGHRFDTKISPAGPATPKQHLSPASLGSSLSASSAPAFASLRHPSAAPGLAHPLPLRSSNNPYPCRLRFPNAGYVVSWLSAALTIDAAECCPSLSRKEPLRFRARVSSKLVKDLV
jgi:hypothetical protein